MSHVALDGPEAGSAVIPHKAIQFTRTIHRTDMRFGPLCWSRVRSSESWSSHPVRAVEIIEAAPRPVWGASRVFGAVIALVACVPVFALLSGGESAGATFRYRVVAAVPAVVTAPPPRVAPLRREGEKSATGRVRTIPVSLRPAIDSVASDGDGDAAISADSANGGSSYKTRARAIAAAFATGEVQEWSDGGREERGFAVAGPLEAGEAGACRVMSVLSRRQDGADRVDTIRRCGKATDAVPALHEVVDR